MALCSRVGMVAATFRSTGAQRPFTAARPAIRSYRLLARAHKVELEHEGKTIELTVPDGTSILEAALDKGIDLPHDCKLGVCMTCPAKLMSGTVDQSGSMLSDDVADRGYALLCMAMPQSDCKVMTITEDELLDVQLMTS